ncbi:hypothetical protein EJ08DRAFT_597680 [Tothia fuscella]|uniref:Uncharacterized protein n=1 Tax=Tothia fuscella TaxID=1048955 RepID=A0A9P4NHB0_9PEZI|nr:hypothetical protein EJ08DRAFT_597680 [Tothia fuscella]
MPASDEQSQARRPAAVMRHSSASSQISQSPSEPSSSHRGPGLHKSQRHVVGHHGHSRLGATRNASFGKNLNKLKALAPANDGATPSSATNKQHKRNTSGDSINGSFSNSPRPAIKRNASAFVVPRNTSHSALKKNHSSGHLSRHASSKNVMKTARHQAAPLNKRTRSSRSSPPEAPHPTVRFALGDKGGHGEEPEHEDNEWTEESASASPHTTRSSTPARQNSVTAEGSMAARAEDSYSRTQSHSQLAPSRSSLKTPPSPRAVDRNVNVQELNGASSYRPSRLPDADFITSRLLQRTPSHNPDPKVSAISATATPEAHVPGSTAHSQGSNLTLAEGTPGRDLVSRFINTSSSGGTPKDGSNFLPKQEQPGSERNELEVHKRNKSTPNFRMEDSPASTRTHSHRSGTSTPTTELPPSRTQQKLLLQRASSHIEPQRHVPAVLPRSGASQLIGHGVSFNEGSLPPQIQGLFHQTAKEYKVVRRFRNPVADAIIRLSEIPNPPRQKKAPRGDENHDRAESRAETLVNDKRRPETNGGGSVRKGVQGLGHKSRVSFDLPGKSQAHDDDEDDAESFPSSETSRVRDEAYEICRRMWEIGEAADG